MVKSLFKIWNILTMACEHEMKAGCKQSDSWETFLALLKAEQHLRTGVEGFGIAQATISCSVAAHALAEVVIPQNVLKAQRKDTCQHFLRALSVLATSVSRAGTELQLQEIFRGF